MRAFVICALVAAAAAAPSQTAAAASVGCAKGTYYWGTWMGKHYCVKCPAGYTSTGCTNCVKDPFHKTCKKNGGQTVKKCGPGKYVDPKSKTGCSACATGRWNNQWDSGVCFDCPKGHFMPNAGMHACYKCQVGYYAAKPRSTTCTKCANCEAGKFSFTQSQGTTSATGCSCVKCARGRYTAAGYSKCFDCPAGRMQKDFGGQTCTKCPEGQYQPSKGSSTCFPCPKGFTTDSTASTSRTACSVPLKSKLSCKAGTYIFFKTSTS